jgi:hypothetical protein
MADEGSGEAGRLEVIGREVVADEEASPNYRLRHVRHRRTGEETWEVLEADGGRSVVVGLASRAEALRIVRGWESLARAIEGGLPGHRPVH